MYLFQPVAVTAATLASSNVSETVALYNAGTTYSLAQQAREDAADGSWIYQSLVGSNTGNPLTDATKWVRVGATNRWAMFDGSTSSQTSNANSISVEIELGAAIDSVALINVDAASVTVTAEDAVDGVVFSETVDLVSLSGIIDLYDYLTFPIERVADTVVTGIPLLYSDLALTVTLTDTGGTARCGACVPSTGIEVGKTQAGASISITDYSRKVQNEFGDYEITERAFAKRADFVSFLENAKIDRTQILFARYRATPIVYLGSSIFGATLIYGFYKSFNIEIPYPEYSLCTVEIEGLT